MDVVCAIWEKDGKWLIARKKTGKSHAGLWEFPGGKVNFNESHKEALIRELMEEMHVAIIPGNLLGKIEHEFFTLFAFQVDGSEIPVSSTDHDALLWADLDTLQSLILCPADQILVRQGILIKNTST